MTTNYAELQVVTKPAILSYPSLFKARPKHPKTPNVLTYQAAIVLPPSFDLGPIKAAMAAAKTKMDRKGVIAPARRITENMDPKGNPLHKAEEKTKVGEDGKPFLPKGYEPGGHFITVHKRVEDGRPTLVDERVQPVIDEAKFYAGCWCAFHIGAFVWENEGKWGVSFGLNGVQFVKDGERLGGRPDISSQFAPIAGAMPPAAAAEGGAADDPFS